MRRPVWILHLEESRCACMEACVLFMYAPACVPEKAKKMVVGFMSVELLFALPVD